ncbi:MAG TPA: hypothetical protein VFM53_01845 [Anaeromyxobacteraceae bacterium]|nr:hypothetical protein [Anaeromyxobacteraceae bacterium]
MNERTKGFVAVLLLAAAGCATLTHGGTRQAYVADAMRNYAFPKPCEELWVDALKLVAEQGFHLVGADRKLVGQDEQGFITNFLNRGHSTTRDDDGVLETETDSNRQGFRYLIRGKPGEKKTCFVTFTGIQEEKVNASETRYRDYEQELMLLSRVDPAAAARILDAADKAK